MTRFLTILAFLLVTIAAWGRTYTVDDVPNVQVADSTRFVSNPDGILSSSTVAALDRELLSLRRATTAEVAVVAVDDIDSGTDIDQFATDLFTKWGIGKADTDNGVLVLLVKDQRKVTIRTGQGSEAVVTDLAAGRIIRNVMTPYFRQGNYDQGVAEGVGRIAQLIANPDAAGDIRSSQPNAHNGGTDAEGLWQAFIMLAMILGGGSLVLVLWRIVATRRDDDVTRYRSLERLDMPVLLASFLSVGLALPAWLILRLCMRRVRLRPRKCPNCGTKMKRLSEEEDNRYLTPAQDAEERLDSIDYDVWLCPNCNATEVIPYINRKSAYTECPRCHAHTYALLSEQVLQPATSRRAGRGVRIYTCRHCGYRHDEPFDIPRHDDAAVAAGAVGAILGSGRGGGGFGGFGGGGFGGGSSMGGGATGGW